MRDEVGLKLGNRVVATSAAFRKAIVSGNHDDGD